MQISETRKKKPRNRNYTAINMKKLKTLLYI